MVRPSLHCSRDMRRRVRTALAVSLAVTGGKTHSLAASGVSEGPSGFTSQVLLEQLRLIERHWALALVKQKYWLGCVSRKHSMGVAWSVRRRTALQDPVFQVAEH